MEEEEVRDVCMEGVMEEEEVRDVCMEGVMELKYYSSHSP